MKISELELQELREKATKWDNFCAGNKRNVNSMSREQRRVNARNAVNKRWEMYRAAKRLGGADKKV